MEGEKSEALRAIKVEKRAQTGQMLGLPATEPRITSLSSYSPSLSPPLHGSALSALQCKLEEMSHSKCKGKRKPDHFLEVPLEQSVQRKVDKGQPWASQILPMGQGKKLITNDKKGFECQLQMHTVLTGSQNEACDKQGGEDSGLWFANRSCGLGEGSSLEDIVTDRAWRSLSPKPTSFPRRWVPPTGFWRLAQPEAQLLNREGASSLTIPGNMPHTCEGELWRRQKLRVGGVAVHKELQRLNSLESAFHRRFQKEASPVKVLGQLWRANGGENLHAQAGSMMERVETDQKYIEKCKTRAVETMTAKHTDVCHLTVPIYKGLHPSYEETDWETVASTYGLEQTPRNATSHVLSPRHEQAKRLLEEARCKARSQNPDSKHVTRSADREEREPLPMYDSPAAQRPLLVVGEEKLAPHPSQLLEIHGRTSMGFSEMCGQSPTHVRFEDESEKEAERRYMDRVSERGPGRSQVSQQTKAGIGTVSQTRQEFRAGRFGIPVATLTSEGRGSSLETVVLQENFRRCRTCRSVLMAGPAKDSSYKDAFSGGTQSQGKMCSRWLASGHLGHQIIHPGILGGVTLTGGYIAGSTDPTGVGAAVERGSAFGKLRRRSRKGSGRVEASHGPYVRRQEPFAQRWSSRARSNLEDVINPLSKQSEAPAHVTFVQYTSQEPSQSKEGTSRNFPGPQLPIKSALKSGCTNRLVGQRGGKQISGSLGMASQTSQAASATSMSPSSLRHSSPALTPEIQALGIWEAAAPVDGEEGCSGAPHSPVMRGVATSKTDAFRAEFLREYRKAELQWDDKRSAEREVKPRLSLCRFFSAMGLNSVGRLVRGSRSSSMEHLSSSPSRHGSASPSSCSPRHASPSSAPKGLLQRTPSHQHLHTGSSLAKLRKATSVQNLQSPKRKLEQSTVLGAVLLPLGLGPREIHSKEGVEPLAGSGGGAPQGQLVQVLPDGTLLLELTRPENRPFGFVISRGKGRPDSGIYVVQIGSKSSTDNVCNGLLGVGDEILEVNGEKVAGMNLDLVTRILTCDRRATIRIVPHHWIHH